MITTYCDIEDYYEVKTTTNLLKLSVNLGQDSNGGYLLFHGDRIIGANVAGELKKEDFNQDWLTISVTVKNKPHATAWASVVLTLQEDSCIPKTFGPYRKIMEEHTDTACFKIKIKLTK